MKKTSKPVTFRSVLAELHERFNSRAPEFYSYEKLKKVTDYLLHKDIQTLLTNATVEKVIFANYLQLSFFAVEMVNDGKELLIEQNKVQPAGSQVIKPMSPRIVTLPLGENVDTSKGLEQFLQHDGEGYSFTYTAVNGEEQILQDTDGHKVAIYPEMNPDTIYPPVYKGIKGIGIDKETTEEEDNCIKVEYQFFANYLDSDIFVGSLTFILQFHEDYKPDVDTLVHNFLLSLYYQEDKALKGTEEHPLDATWNYDVAWANENWKIDAQFRDWTIPVKE